MPFSARDFRRRGQTARRRALAASPPSAQALAAPGLVSPQNPPRRKAPPKAEPVVEAGPRRCTRCSALLSRYNPEPECFAHTYEEPVVKPPRFPWNIGSS